MRTMIMTLLAVLGLGLWSCNTVDNEAVPSYTVRIDLGSMALWNTYGVSGVGDWRIFSREKLLPRNFPYNVNTYTGFGGVLLMMALDPATASYAPQAWSAACPVERNADVLVSVDPQDFEAFCPKCGSRYNVLTGSGGPVSGDAFRNKLGLRQYRVRQSMNGGYIVTSY